jgi:ATP-binding cassette subfamily B protein RaxB
VGGLPLYAGLRCVLYFELRDAAAEQIVFSAKQSTHFYETANGIQSIRLFDKGEQRRAGWMNILADQFNAELRILRVRVNYETAQTVVFGLERILVVWLAARAVLDGAFTAGMLFAFISYKDQFSTRIAALTDRLLEFKMLGLHAERVADIVMAMPEQDSHAEFAETPLPTVAPRIELRNVSYRYAPGEPFIFENVSLTVEASECIAITGASGCGKTTLVKVLLGLLEPEQGEILMNGVPIKHIGLTAYRRQIGTVMQEDRLFSGSIAENISFFDTLPDWDRIRETAAKASIDKEIEQMPMGYNTITGSNGIGISGGQQQRVLLARALYRQPQMLVLDEATSELDVANERSVNTTVKQLGLTRIIVAHRPETIGMADRVIAFRNGKLIDVDTSAKPVFHSAS